jgi:hypothetical protein
MHLNRWVVWAMTSGAVVWMTIGAQMNAWAGERNALVRSGSQVAPTAQFVMAGDGESLLAPGSDSRLRVIVDGDLATAGHVAVLVPGVDTSPERFDSALANGVTGSRPDGLEWWKTTPGWARSLRLATAEVTPGGMEDVAVVAWLGYVTPTGWAGVVPDAMEQGAANLVAFDEFLDRARPDADVTWVCHSYGSLVCSSALVSTDPATLMLIGSPGVGVDKASQLATTAEIWVGEADADMIKLTELVSLAGGAFGTRPSAPDFGARTLPCDAGDGHSDYFRPGSTQLATMASVVL